MVPSHRVQGWPARPYTRACNWKAPAMPCVSRKSRKVDPPSSTARDSVVRTAIASRSARGSAGSVDDRTFHTYSVYARGLESIGGSYYVLDETALGRQEDWEKPEGRAEAARAAIPDFAP